MEEKRATFQYTYSAAQQEEIKSIRQKYVSNEDEKMSQLRQLDESVTRLGTILSILVGIVGTLVFGVGMTCVLEWHFIGLGCMIGIIGCVGIALAYPLYKIITKKQKEKLALSPSFLIW